MSKANKSINVEIKDSNGFKWRCDLRIVYQ